MNARTSGTARARLPSPSAVNSGRGVVRVAFASSDHVHIRELQR